MLLRPFIWGAALTMVAAGLGAVARPAHGQSSWGPSSRVGGTCTNCSSNTVQCPAGKYAIGLEVTAGSYVHMMRLECANIGLNGQHSSVQYASQWLGHDKDGVSVRQLRCADGKVLVGFRGRGGWWIDQVAAACKSWSAGDGGSTGTASWTSAAGGTGGTAHGPLLCPSRYAVTQVEGQSDINLLYGWLVIGYKFSCRAP